ncbi:MAG: serine/threonine protein kinase [Erysipelotrichaceae bacterium]|nr:serine/threonine protein kinase [Erysipelotrichaceae bacterium]
MDRFIKVNDVEYQIIRLLGHGKGGYSYLALSGDKEVVLKQIHHEPCDYYSFGDKLEAEKNDYKRLKKIGIRIPELIDIDDDQEIIIKEYIKGPTVYELIEKGISVKPYLDQVREMADIAKSSGLNIDYYPTNFIVNNGLLWYIDYECNEYMDKWSFENWGISYWLKTEV